MSFLVKIHGDNRVVNYLGMPVVVNKAYYEGWLAMDASGAVYAYTCVPIVRDEDLFWSSSTHREDGNYADAIAHFSSCTEDLPYRSDWKTTLVRIPELEEWK